MSVTFVQEFVAAPDRADDLRTTLRSLVPLLEGAAGCESCRLVQSHDNPARFMVVAVWASRDAQEHAAGDVPVGLLHRAMTLVAEMPRGGIWTDCS